jgi:hypothetical protein
MCEHQIVGDTKEKGIHEGEAKNKDEGSTKLFMRRKALAKANSSLLHHTQPHTQQGTIGKRYMGCARNSIH